MYNKFCSKILKIIKRYNKNKKEEISKPTTEILDPEVWLVQNKEALENIVDNIKDMYEGGLNFDEPDKRRRLMTRQRILK